MTRLRRFAAFAAFATFTTLETSSTVEAASPSLSSIFPRGGQRGTEVEFTFGGARLADAKEILFYSPGFETVELEKVEGGKVVARIKIAPDCRLGVHCARIRTASGITELKTFFVGALKPTAEKEPNSKFDTPQKI